MQNECYGPLWQISRNDEMAGILGMLALDIVLYFGAFLYLDQVVPRAYGIPQHPLLCLKPLLDRCRRRKAGAYDELIEEAAFVDPDVLREVERADALSDAQVGQYPLVLKRLRKVYGGAPRAAIKSLSLVVEASECFGLLGENGAGTVTTPDFVIRLH